MSKYDHLSPLAQKLGAWMARQCADGLPAHVDEGLANAFPDVEVKQIKLALAELKADGLVELNSAINRAMPSVRTTIALFVAADPAITGHDPRKDAVLLARMMIENPKLGNIRELEAAVGWPRRRFNPAVGLLVPLFPHNRMRTPLQNDYPVLGFIVGDDEIVSLRRFVQSHTR
ncbi:hypothetical protein [uncultured Sphingomonas sp.]|uniref:hypothetical protein n=1 Tax=uncultured Sphingomonas sp. TaxID=158754 RepID=UPI003749BF12